jgi:hypothetical protein
MSAQLSSRSSAYHVVPELDRTSKVCSIFSRSSAETYRFRLPFSYCFVSGWSRRPIQQIMNGPRHLFGEIIDRLLFFRPKIHPKREPYYHKPHYR